MLRERERKLGGLLELQLLRLVLGVRPNISWTVGLDVEKSDWTDSAIRTLNIFNNYLNKFQVARKLYYSARKL